jgi:hypothetical protein
VADKRKCTYCWSPIPDNLSIGAPEKKPEAGYCSVDCMERDTEEPASENMRMIAEAGGFRYPRPKLNN